MEYQLAEKIKLLLRADQVSVKITVDKQYQDATIHIHVRKNGIETSVMVPEKRIDYFLRGMEFMKKINEPLGGDTNE